MSRFTLPRGYLSASSIGMLLKCPKQFEFRYVKGLVIPPGAALVVGSSAHKALEGYFKDAMTSSQRMTGKQAGEYSVAALEEVLSEKESTISTSDVEMAKGLLPGLIETYVENVGCDIQPLAVEEELRFTMSCGVPILAYIDLRHQAAEDAEGIVDYKVTEKRWDIGTLRNSLQFNLYAIGTGIGDISVHNLVKAKSKVTRARPKAVVDGVTDYTPNLRVLSHQFDGSMVQHMERMVESAAQLITSGIFMPCDPGSWVCSETWCGYWKLCRGAGQTVYSLGKTG